MAKLRRLPRLAAVGFITAFLLVYCPGPAFARGGFSGGGFRSAPSMRSFGAPRLSVPRLTAPRLSTPRSAPLSGWGSATRPGTGATTPRLAPAAGTGTGTTLGRSAYTSQRSVYDSARRSGTLFSSKTEAQTAFKSQYGSQYGSTFAAEPASRPAWIPQSTTVGGRGVNVLYNAGLGGYGYIDPILGTWILYDVLSDAAMADSLMNRHNYYYGAPVYLSHGTGFLGTAIALLFAFMVLSAIMRAFRYRGRR